MKHKDLLDLQKKVREELSKPASETPRTDALLHEISLWECEGQDRLKEHARQLERELQLSQRALKLARDPVLSSVEVWNKVYTL